MAVVEHQDMGDRKVVVGQAGEVPGQAGEVPASDVSAAVETIASFLTTFEPARFAGADAAALVELFARGERLCLAGRTLAAGRAAEAACHRRGGHRSPAHWLASVTGESVGEAMDGLALAGRLAGQPGVAGAFRAGRLSKSKAKAVAGAVAANPASEDELLGASATDTLSELRDRCLRARRQGRSEEDAAAAYEAVRRARRCRTWTDPDGSFRLEARLAPDAGAALAAALSTERSRRFDEARAAGEEASPDHLAADALVALVARGAEGSAAGAAPRGPRALVHLRVDVAALRRGEVGPGECCEIPGVGPVPLAVARELLGDAVVKLVVADGVDVTSICHLGRSIPAALRTALAERDPCCVVPGCGVAHGLEIDHRIVPFKDGGPASMENLARLCRHHHALRTHRGFRLEGGPGHWEWLGPDREPPPPPAPGGHRNGHLDGPPDGPPDGHAPPLFTPEE